MSDIGSASPNDKVILSGGTFNTIARTVRELAQQTAGGAAPGDARRQAGVVLVKNTTGAAVDRFAVLGIDGVLYEPTTDDDDPKTQTFKNATPLVGVTPSSAHTGKFVITLAPAASGEIVPAVASGVAVCKIESNADDSKFADVAEGQTGKLAAAATGAARILWLEYIESPGLRWAVVRLGDTGAAALQYGQVVDEWEWTGANEVTINPCDSDGANLDEDTEIVLAFVTPDDADLGLRPRVEAGDVLAYLALEAGNVLLPVAWESVPPTGAMHGDGVLLTWENLGHADIGPRAVGIGSDGRALSSNNLWTPSIISVCGYYNYGGGPFSGMEASQTGVEINTWGGWTAQSGHVLQTYVATNNTESLWDLIRMTTDDGTFLLQVDRLTGDLFWTISGTYECTALTVAVWITRGNGPINVYRPD